MELVILGALDKKIPGIIYGDKKDPIPVYLLDEKILN